MKKINLAITGCMGRMGQQLIRSIKKDKNLLLLKTEMKGGHGGKSGRDSGIEEMAFDYSFILKMSKTKV